jgi:uncharacterized RDD family membrane protein YckC
VLPEESSPATTLASVPRRLVARIFDGALVGLVWLIPMAVTGHASRTSLTSAGWMTYAVWATAVVYEIYLISQTGQTIGKRLLSIQVVDATSGAVPTIDQAARRAVPTIIQVLPLLDIATIFFYAPILWRPRRQGVHDRIAGTVVIDLRVPGAGAAQPSS